MKISNLKKDIDKLESDIKSKDALHELVVALKIMINPTTEGIDKLKRMVELNPNLKSLLDNAMDTRKRTMNKHED